MNEQSIIYMMKSTNVTYLKCSVSEGLWSNKEGANRVLQGAWEKRPPGAKIVLLFSVTHRYAFDFMLKELLVDT